MSNDIAKTDEGAEIITSVIAQMVRPAINVEWCFVAVMFVANGLYGRVTRTSEWIFFLFVLYKKEYYDKLFDVGQKQRFTF